MPEVNNYKTYLIIASFIKLIVFAIYVIDKERHEIENAIVIAVIVFIIIDIVLSFVITNIFILTGMFNIALFILAIIVDMPIISIFCVVSIVFWVVVDVENRFGNQEPFNTDLAKIYDTCQGG